MRARYRVWLEEDGPVFGDGLAELLGAVAELGSLRAAAARMGMSYRAAWGRVRRSEDRLGWRLVRYQVGGRAGGGAAITPRGQHFLAGYADFRRRLDAEVEAAFAASGLGGLVRGGG
jgi:molybdate transport system regulatory protein